MSTPKQVKKQISFWLPLDQWKALQIEAARQQIPITELCLKVMNPEIRRLTRSS